MNSDDAQTAAVEAALYQIRRAKHGKQEAIKYVLDEAAGALQHVINGQPCSPDAAQREYLQFVLEALKFIVASVDARKAFGLSEGGRPSRGPPWPLFKYFFFVGMEYNDQPKGQKCMKAAKQTVAHCYDVGFATVEKAWTYYGSWAGWKQSFPEELEETPR